ncbi:MAG: hypothetical protein MJ186_07035 [Clostridia bacterium]|nr:hypothetical protein [Clostridia bacterium]
MFSDPMYALDRSNDGWIDKIFEGKDPEEEIHTEIKLKDFVDYYPIYGTVDLPGLFYSIDILYFDPEELQAIKEKEAAEPYAGELETALAINEFFRIPVLEDETVIFDGYFDSYNTGSKDSTDSFYLYTEGVCTEDKCLFWFSNRTNKDNTVDCSLIPGGYGIYCLPFKNTEESGKGYKVQKTEIFPDKLANVYPLDEESTVMDISLDKDGKLLRMVTLDKDKMFRLTIIDTESFECLQVTDIGPADENEWCIVKSEDNFIVCIEDDSTEDEGTLHVYYDPGSGVYEERICIPMDYSDENSADSFAWLYVYLHSIVFDG